MADASESEVSGKRLNYSNLCANNWLSSSLSDFHHFETKFSAAGRGCSVRGLQIQLNQHFWSREIHIPLWRIVHRSRLIWNGKPHPDLNQLQPSVPHPPPVHQPGPWALCTWPWLNGQRPDEVVNVWLHLVQQVQEAALGLSDNLLRGQDKGGIDITFKGHNRRAGSSRGDFPRML